MSVSSSVRRTTVTAAIAAALVGAVALPAAAAQQSAAPHRAPVFISKVQADSPGRDDRSNRSLNAEWVDVTNSTRQTVDLDRWTLRDDAGHTYTFRHVRLAPRATVRVHTGIGRDTRSDLYQDKRNYVWNNNGDTATLRNDRGRTVDTVSWGRDRHRH
ncbi:lamin tail domain-containing protein [Streptomyces monashensis]|uniref:lamin tail domain-containing protein n=1 Tax=Streptomyces monashensis TaxID=1678012 RepID=UPI0033F530DC